MFTTQQQPSKFAFRLTFRTGALKQMFRWDHKQALDKPIVSNQSSATNRQQLTVSNLKFGL